MKRHMKDKVWEVPVQSFHTFSLWNQGTSLSKLIRDAPLSAGVQSFGVSLC